ncbi:hypothetical protein OJF2_54050 [Aquisphaera giovannonii]|uniref:Uncharacterized protein n=1 Tax=Aquisphaera giovannonii TaxID=406548 RepID=A0A5B9WAD1_9BACT|nr:hypothetical protein OJF2_54050 [Aquisphaera giovannonii]
MRDARERRRGDGIRIGRLALLDLRELARLVSLRLTQPRTTHLGDGPREFPAERGALAAMPMERGGRGVSLHVVPRGIPLAEVRGGLRLDLLEPCDPSIGECNQEGAGIHRRARRRPHRAPGEVHEEEGVAARSLLACRREERLAFGLALGTEGVPRQEQGIGLHVPPDVNRLQAEEAEHAVPLLGRECGAGLHAVADPSPLPDEEAPPFHGALEPGHDHPRVLALGILVPPARPFGEEHPSEPLGPGRQLGRSPPLPPMRLEDRPGQGGRLGTIGTLQVPEQPHCPLGQALANAGPGLAGFPGRVRPHPVDPPPRPSPRPRAGGGPRPILRADASLRLLGHRRLPPGRGVGLVQTDPGTFIPYGPAHALLDSRSAEIFGDGLLDLLISSVGCVKRQRGRTGSPLHQEPAGRSKKRSRM